MEVLLDIMYSLYDTLKYSIKDVMLLPGVNILQALVYSTIATLVSILCYWFEIPFFLDYRGCLLSTLIISVLVFFGKNK